MMLALKQLRTAPLQRKAMVVISDGGDNHSRITEQELKSKLKEAGVQMYAIGIYDPFAYRKEERLGPFELDELTSASGGRMISVRNRAEILSAVRRISRELRDQYVLGYYPSRPERDGKWHKVKVTLTGISNPRELRVFSRKGYFQPAD
jgi:Ca-activated chloride channel family protein